MSTLKEKNRLRRQNAEKRGIHYGLSNENLENLLIVQRCYYLNCVLNPVSGFHKIDNKMTIDRLNPNKGYIEGNVVTSSNIANQLKSMVEDGTITADDIIGCGMKIKSALKID